MALFEELAAVPADQQALRLKALHEEDEELTDELTRLLAEDSIEHAATPPTPLLRGVPVPGVASPSPVGALPPPERFGHYRLEKKLGAGGMGVVYVAVDERLGRRVAIKLLPEGAAWRIESRLRMVREAQAASALNHPGIVTVHDVEASEGRLAVVMELIDGENFHALAARGVTQAEALRLTAEAADALAFAHAAGVLHRDIKSENLMRTRDGRVKVLDFGVAKIVGEAMRGRSSAVWELASSPRTNRRGPAPPYVALETTAGSVMGTPACLAPELTLGDPPTPKSEVFSLGVALFELLTGTRPFGRESLHATLAAVRECKVPPPSQLKPGIAPEVDAIVLKALARQPRDRYADMTELAAAIRGLSATPPAPPRRRWPIYVAGGAILLGAATAITLLLMRDRGDAGPVLAGMARRLTFDLGCEEFPSFTPDGQTLVFDALVDGDYEIVALDLGAGSRRRLTRTPGWDYAAIVSPDGTRVAYVHQRDSNSVRVVPLAGGEPFVIGQSDGYPAWSQRGTVLFGADDAVREWDETGGVRVVVPVPANRRALYLAPFSDGQVAAILGTSDQEVAPELALIDGTGLRRVPITDALELPIAASPSGTGLYYQRTTAAGVELVRRPRDGSGKAVILEGGVTATGSLAFTRDGQRLAYSTCRSTSYLARIAGGRAQPLTRAGGWTDGFPVAVDDGHVWFTSDRAGTSQVWKLDVASGAAEPVTPGGTLRATVAGRRAAWAVLEPPGIVVADLDERGVPGTPRRLTDRRGDTAPQLSGDASLLFFVRLDEEGGERVWMIPTAGGVARPITPPHAAVASVSAAGELAYLVSHDADGVDVVVTDLAGGESSVAATLPAGAFRSLRHSPDGKRLLVIREDQEILEIDRTEMYPPRITSLWRGETDSATAVEYGPDGKTILASIVVWDGDIWMVDGRF